MCWLLLVLSCMYSYKDIYRFCYEIWYILFPIDLNELKCTENTTWGERSFIPNLELIWENLIFHEIMAFSLIWVIYTFYCPEMYGMYRTNCYGPEMHEIYKKNHYGAEIYEIYKKNTFIVKIMGKIKLRVTNFAYVIPVPVTIMYINFLMKLWVLLKVTVQLIYYWSKWFETCRMYWGWCD